MSPRRLTNLILGFILLFLASKFLTTTPQSNVLGSISPSPTSTTISVPTITPAPNSTLAKVVKVVDGDTIKVDLDGTVETIRLIGVDTPEVVDPRKPVQCFGKEASAKTKELLTDQIVTLVSDPTQGDRDKYQRLLRYVYLQNLTFINKILIEEGYAFEYTYHLPYKFQAEFKEAQKQAEIGKHGLWADNACTTPTSTQ